MSLDTNLVSTNRRRSSIYVHTAKMAEHSALMVSVPSQSDEMMLTQENDLYRETSILREMKFVSSSSLPLILTFLMQYSLSLSSLFVIGNLCVDPETGSSAKYLSSASLAVMTYNIMGLAVIEGLATSLDTFCSQAYGAKDYRKVGLYTQRCALMILACLIPIICLWYCSEFWLKFFIPQKELLGDVQTFLRIISFGVPALTMFEAGKRFAQAQGLYNISTYALIGVFPINLVLIYVLTNTLGFKGAPIAIAISHWLMFFSLAGYCMFVRKDSLKCWAPIFPAKVSNADGFFKKISLGLSVLILGTDESSPLDEETVFDNEEDESDNDDGYGAITNSQPLPILKKKSLPIFQNWKPMIEMAWPGLVMIESEYLSFEILTIFSTYLGDETEIAIQTVLASVGTLIYQDIFAIGCVIGTRVAQFIGTYYEETLNKASANPLEYNDKNESLAKRNAIKCIKACYIVSVFMGLLNWSILFFFSKSFARLFTQDETVIETSSLIMPILAFNQFPDAFNVFSAAILRGQGRQKIGGILNIVAYYIISLPLSHFFAFNWGLDISGLWYGGTAGLLFLSSTEVYFVAKTDWDHVLNTFVARLNQENQA